MPFFNNIFCSIFGWELLFFKKIITRFIGRALTSGSRHMAHNNGIILRIFFWRTVRHILFFLEMTLGNFNKRNSTRSYQFSKFIHQYFNFLNTSLSNYTGLFLSTTRVLPIYSYFLFTISSLIYFSLFRPTLSSLRLPYLFDLSQI